MQNASCSFRLYPGLHVFITPFLSVKVWLSALLAHVPEGQYISRKGLASNWFIYSIVPIIGSESSYLIASTTLSCFRKHSEGKVLQGDNCKGIQNTQPLTTEALQPNPKTSLAPKPREHQYKLPPLPEKKCFNL